MSFTQNDVPTKSVLLLLFLSITEKVWYWYWMTSFFKPILWNIMAVFTNSSMMFVIMFIFYYVTCSTITILFKNRTVLVLFNSSVHMLNFILLLLKNFIFMFTFIIKNPFFHWYFFKKIVYGFIYFFIS